MWQHVLFFATFSAASIAENWLKAHFELEDIQSYDYEPYMCKFYVSPNLSERQQEIISETLNPVNYLINEL